MGETTQPTTSTINETAEMRRLLALECGGGNPKIMRNG
jgi:hypothetical protein